MKNIRGFFSENVHFLMEKFLVYLNRLVFVMARRWIGSQTEWRLLPQYVLEAWHLIIYVCGQTHCGAPCGFLVVCFQIVIEYFALFHYSVCDSCMLYYDDSQTRCDNFCYFLLLYCTQNPFSKEAFCTSRKHTHVVLTLLNRIFI